MDSVAKKNSLSQSGHDFIDEDRLHGLLDLKPDDGRIGEVIAKSLAK